MFLLERLQPINLVSHFIGGNPVQQAQQVADCLTDAEFDLKR